MCLFSWVYCLLRTFTSIIPEGFEFIDYIVDMVYCMFSACMQSQQNAELDYQRGPKGKTMH